MARIPWNSGENPINFWLLSLASSREAMEFSGELGEGREAALAGKGMEPGKTGTDPALW